MSDQGAERRRQCPLGRGSARTTDLPIRTGADVDDVIGYRHRWRDAAECRPGNYDEPLPRTI